MCSFKDEGEFNCSHFLGNNFFIVKLWNPGFGLMFCWGVGSGAWRGSLQLIAKIELGCLRAAVCAKSLDHQTFVTFYVFLTFYLLLD